MNKFKYIVIGAIIYLLNIFFVSKIANLLILGSLIISLIVIIIGDDYIKANKYVKYAYLLSIGSILILFFLFDSLFSGDVDKLSLYYQFLVFSFVFLLVVNIFSIFFIKKTKLDIKLKNSNFSKFEFNDGAMKQRTIEINPASGLPMKNGIDSVGNIIGQNSNNSIDKN